LDHRQNQMIFIFCINSSTSQKKIKQKWFSLALLFWFYSKSINLIFRI
jgi:hypothetical protein